MPTRCVCMPFHNLCLVCESLFYGWEYFFVIVTDTIYIFNTYMHTPRSFSTPTYIQDSSTPSRMQLSYESSSAAGKGLMSKCPTPVPYFVPPNGLGIDLFISVKIFAFVCVFVFLYVRGSESSKFTSYVRVLFELY